MKRSVLYIFFVLLVLPFFTACEKWFEEPSVGVYDKDVIVPYCKVDNNISVEYAIGYLGTKSLINSTSTPDAILCNFLRLDEVAQAEGVDGITFNDDYVTEWGKSYVSEGSISTIAGEDYLRSVSLSPTQPYTTGKKSRMVGWYPRTCELSNKDGESVTAQSDLFKTKIIKTDTYIGVKFDGLDGKTDIMVSDVKEGANAEDLYFSSDNYFTFKHYLSAVKVYATAQNSSQDVGMWGQIKSVVVKDQPSNCTVALPTKPFKEGGSSGYGEVVEWGDDKIEFHVDTTKIFGNDDSQNNVAAEPYPVNLEGSSIKKYLGYSLIRPNTTLRLQINTTAGVYDVKISPKYNESNIFQPGVIYNVHLDFKTDGTIMAFIENEANEKYLDLTKGEVSADVFEYKHANCYVIYSDAETVGEGNAKKLKYDGFCFDATVIGNGEAGMIANGAQTLYPLTPHISPASADVLWETSPRLIHQIELMQGYVRFKVAKDGNDKYKEGNAVIAVYDQNRKILWSWHIWITDTPNEISYTETAEIDGQQVSTTITVMDRNLGATAANWTGDADALQTYGLYYQWGRKDPSMGPPQWTYSSINMTTAPYYDYSSEEYTAANVLRLSAPELKDAVENPMYLILPSAYPKGNYYFDWLNEKYDFLWGYAASTENVHKTIYDPCPYGYRVPAGELVDVFGYARRLDIESANNSKSSPYVYSDYGQIVKLPNSTKKPIKDKTVQGSTYNDGIYFPYTGYKGVDRGLNSLVSSWKYVGHKADYQSAIISNYSNDDDDKMYLAHRSRIYLSKESAWSEVNVGSYSGHQIEDFTNRRTAAPVRCVKDEEMGSRLMAYLTPDKTTVTANSQVNFNLFAESFGTNLLTATLSVGYHLWEEGTDAQGNTIKVEGPHKEVTLQTWDLKDNRLWNPNGYEYTFDFSKIATSLGIDNINNTTGTFRFVLTVTNKKNITRISSATVTLAQNHISFSEWDRLDQQDPNRNIVYIGEPIVRQFRIYGDARPIQVLMYINDSQQPIDITANLNFTSTESSSYAYDCICSTSGLSFSSAGENSTVTFEVIYDGGVASLVSDFKTFRVKAIKLTPWNSNQNFETGYYVIQNVGTSGYLYDADTYMKATTDCTYSNFFYITEYRTNDNTFSICNVKTGHYVIQYPKIGNSADYQITTTASNSATYFNMSYSNETFKIYKTYYWKLDYNNSNVTGVKNSNGNVNWKIYKVSYE